MILFCLPYAGGSEAVFFNWKKYLKGKIEVYPVKLKGRGSRFNEEFYRDIEDAVDDIYDSIKEKIESKDYAVFGHSMGSLLAYELYYKIVKMGKRKPKHMFFSGFRSPNMRLKMDISYKMSDKEFTEEIISLGGTPEEIINNKEIMDIFIPILKNDIRILEEYVYVEKKEKIKCSISIFNGKEDKITAEEESEWKKLCEGKCNIYHFDGNHFYINDKVKEITKLILNEVL